MELLWSIVCLLLFLAVAWTKSPGYLHDEPRMITLPSTLNVLEGATIKLPCVAENMEDKVRIWKRLPSQTLFSGSITVSRDERIKLLEGSALQISDVTPEYAGDYACVVYNHASLNVTHRIRVQIPPSIEPEPPHGRVTVRKGNPATITCMVKGIPSPEISWTYQLNGAKSSLPSGVRLTNEGTQLQVAQVDVQHAGIYTCTAVNDVGGPVTETFNFTVLYAPEVSVYPEWVHGDEGATVEFRCTSKSSPPSQVAWWRGDLRQAHPLHSDNHVHVRVAATKFDTVEMWLKIQRIHREDLGSYSCIANNSVGQNGKTVEISGLAEPVELSGSESGKDSYLLKWTAKSHSPIIEFQLKIRRHKSGDDWVDVPIPVPKDEVRQTLFFSQHYDVTGLQPGVRYEAVLQARNDFGWNRPSETFFFSAGQSSVTTLGETNERTVLPLYDAELDITDPTYLKQDLPETSTATLPNPTISFTLVIFCVIKSILEEFQS